MIKLIHIFGKFAIVPICFVSLSLMGCEGTGTREDIDDTVEELAGKKNLDRMEDMKNDIGRIEDQQADRYEQLDDES
ncbi:hypothetical protein ACFL1Z_01825 [Thermodesulfobacteriota bacterium]